MSAWPSVTDTVFAVFLFASVCYLQRLRALEKTEPQTSAQLEALLAQDPAENERQPRDDS